MVKTHIEGLRFKPTVAMMLCLTVSFVRDTITIKIYHKNKFDLYLSNDWMMDFSTGKCTSMGHKCTISPGRLKVINLIIIKYVSLRFGPKFVLRLQHLGLYSHRCFHSKHKLIGKKSKLYLFGAQIMSTQGLCSLVCSSMRAHQGGNRKRPAGKMT